MPGLGEGGCTLLNQAGSCRSFRANSLAYSQLQHQWIPDTRDLYTCMTCAHALLPLPVAPECPWWICLRTDRVAALCNSAASLQCYFQPVSTHRVLFCFEEEGGRFRELSKVNRVVFVWAYFCSDVGFYASLAVLRFISLRFIMLCNVAEWCGLMSCIKI